MDRIAAWIGLRPLWTGTDDKFRQIIVTGYIAKRQFGKSSSLWFFQTYLIINNLNYPSSVLQLCVKHPLAVFMFGTLIAVLCSSGMLFVRFTTDPVELWSSWTSKARGEKYFFDNEFGFTYHVLILQNIFIPTGRFIQLFPFHIFILVESN